MTNNESYISTNLFITSGYLFTNCCESLKPHASYNCLNFAFKNNLISFLRKVGTNSGLSQLCFNLFHLSSIFFRGIIFSGMFSLATKLGSLVTRSILVVNRAANEQVGICRLKHNWPEFTMHLRTNLVKD